MCLIAARTSGIRAVRRASRRRLATSRAIREAGRIAVETAFPGVQRRLRVAHRLRGLRHRQPGLRFAEANERV